MTLAELMVPVMNASLVMGVGVVLPIAFSRPFTPFLIAALAVAASLSVAPGWPAALVLAPWLLLCVAEGVKALRRRVLVHSVMAGFGFTAALALVASRLEVTVFEIPEPIVKLTALHFTFAGVGSLSLAGRLVQQRATAVRRLAGLVVMGAPPVVALGFITRLAVFQVGGAVLMALGVCALGALQVGEALRRKGLPQALLLVSAASPWVAMGLGVAWAASQYWPTVPSLSVPDMVPTHGALNAFGFVLGGHLAWWLDERGY